MSNLRIINLDEAARLFRNSTPGPWETDAGRDAAEVRFLAPLHDQYVSVIGWLNNFSDYDVDLLMEAPNLAYTADLLGRQLAQVRDTVSRVRDHLSENGPDSDVATQAALLDELLGMLEKPASSLRWKHTKTGGKYDQVLVADVQASNGPIREGQRLVVYRGANGKLWAREEDEFNERFESLAFEVEGS